MEETNKTRRCDLLDYLIRLVYDTGHFKCRTHAPERDAEIDGILEAFRGLYAVEKEHGIETKRACLRRAYWEVYQSDYVSFKELELELMVRALELMKSARFKRTLKGIGEDMDTDEESWYLGWLVASHYVLLGSEAVSGFVRNRKDAQLKAEEDWTEPMFETDRLYELADNQNPHFMFSLLRFPGFGVDEEERKLNKRWLESRLI